MNDTTADFTMSGVEAKIVRISEAKNSKLPPADTKRWVMRRKAQLISAVRNGTITMEDALARYSLSEEEFKSWEKLFDGHGVRALRSTRLKEYRRHYIEDDGASKY